MKTRDLFSIRGLVRAVGAAAVLATAAPGITSAETVVPMLQCPLGCGGVVGESALAAQMARSGAKIMPAAQETPGYLYNIRVMTEKRRWPTTVFGTEDMVIQAGYSGGEGTMAMFLPEPIKIPFKLLYSQGMAAQGKFFVTYDPNIKSIADLKGKSVAIGLRTQSDWGMAAALILEEGYGITPENTDIRFLTPANLTQQLIDGNVDASLMALVYGADLSSWWTASLSDKMDAAGDIHYLSVSEEAIEAVNEKYGMTLLTQEVPAGVLPQQNEPITVGANRVYNAVHPEFKEDIAYELVMNVAKHGPKLRETGTGFWKFWSKENMVNGLSEENTHPGAIKAYKELGWWKLRKDSKPVTYPEG